MTTTTVNIPAPCPSECDATTYRTALGSMGKCVRPRRDCSQLQTILLHLMRKDSSSVKNVTSFDFVEPRIWLGAGADSLFVPEHDYIPINCTNAYSYTGTGTDTDTNVLFGDDSVSLFTLSVFFNENLRKHKPGACFQSHGYYNSMNAC